MSFHILIHSFHVILYLIHVQGKYFGLAYLRYIIIPVNGVKRDAHHVLFQWTLNLSEHRQGQNELGMTDHNSSNHGPT